MAKSEATSWDRDDERSEEANGVVSTALEKVARTILSSLLSLPILNGVVSTALKKKSLALPSSLRSSPPHVTLLALLVAVTDTSSIAARFARHAF